MKKLTAAIVTACLLLSAVGTAGAAPDETKHEKKMHAAMLKAKTPAKKCMPRA